MENFEGIDLRRCLRKLQALVPDITPSLDTNLLQDDRVWNKDSQSKVLDFLSEQLLVAERTVAIATTFSPLLLELLERVQEGSSRQQFSLARHEQLCAACGRLVSSFPDAQKFIEKYLQTSPPVFERILTGKTKKSSAYKVIAQAARHLVEHSPSTYAELWDWGPFLALLDTKDGETRWHAACTVAAITKMGGVCRQRLLETVLTKEEISRHQIRDSMSRSQDQEGPSQLDNEPIAEQGSTQESQVKGHHVMSKQDVRETVVSVCGVLLPMAAQPEKIKTPSHHLVPVQTTTKNLRRLALAVAAGNGVLLEGPVGCGKTALVEHLAAQTGRAGPPSLLKVQLGDQTDSKALLGTYRCTDIPGEFVWQAGALTQAVTRGDWILLEDIDYAPMDVVSVLLPLLETRSLCVPGHGNVVKAAPGFQLFATQRLLSSSGGLHRQQVSHGAMLDQLWSRVQLEPLSRDELHQVITTLYPKLTTVAGRLLDIYCMLTAGHQAWLDTTDPQGEGGRDDATSSSGGSGDGESRDQELKKSRRLELGSNDRRLVSTRDLIKWCERIVADFEVNSTHTANMVFLEALDCFCSALTKPETRAMVAEAIGARLNITREKARFYCSTYKPEVKETESSISTGRASLQRKMRDSVSLKMHTSSQFAFTRPAAVLVERVACSIAHNEPVLLVGETGTGKTSTVQYLAGLVGQRLKVINMNQQSDSTDLLGGFKPVDLRQVVAPVREAFESVFRATFSIKQNARFLGHVQKCFTQHHWRELVTLMTHSQQAAVKRFQKADKQEAGASKKDADLGSQWRALGEKLHQLNLQIQHSENALAFSFIEGTLVKALRNGDWILLDEINLATAETLECLSSLLESTEGSVVLMERGDTKPIVRHKDFRLFACMNPATDVGKKDLPPGIRNRFTELYVDELEEVQDLKILTKSYLRMLSVTEAQVQGIVQFYLSVRKEAVQKLTDGTGHRPHYSLRTLCRALKLASSNQCDSVSRSLYESFCLSFLTQLDRSSHPTVERLVCRHVIGRSNVKALLGQSIPPPAGVSKHVKVEGYWVGVGENEPVTPKDYVITASVRANLRDLARIVSAGRFPVLVQGETSVGKTSLVTYLARLTGQHCVRVNNHEHTDLQEYVGFYAADEAGKLVFKEGVLVNAMRKGHWIILDELNLAPSDVLEALNRLLDDNRELFIPETQEVIAAHPKFMLFATQNPPGQYGGRKVLSRAFRNRFVELHFDEIPSRELETILHERCEIPASYCRKMVATMLELQTRRKGSGVFAGKQGFITLRDLFRWAERYRRASQGDQTFYDWNQHIADEGYILLAGRVRRPEEAETIRQVLEKNIKRSVNPQHLFSLSEHTSPVTREILEKVTSPTLPPGYGHIVWTYGMCRLAVLVGKALKFGEPVLLVGETGCGKTTICQLFAALANQELYAVNCHLHTETSDFLGGLRPVRHHADETEEESQKLFEWCDGPLILAMRRGSVFLIDEISLADDSVLERLNSVLEPERSLLLAERGSGEEQGKEIAVIQAQEAFRVVSTMNPGGDFGKKELSPALRNRFTEIWCPPSSQRSDLVAIMEHNLHGGVQLCNQEDGSSGVGNAVMDFIQWFANNDVGRKCVVSIRDILSWVNFINICCDPSKTDLSPLDPAVAYIHGACMVFVDGLGSGTTASSSLSSMEARRACIHRLHDQIWQLSGQDVDLSSLLVTSDLQVKKGQVGIVSDEKRFGIEPFFIDKGDSPGSPHGYALDAPTPALNAQRILRALQLPRPILLEGSPGVGKTSLVGALAKASGHQLVRINLSEQTDITDLFGADLPVEGGEGGQFAWRDGPLLQALKAGHWVVLDELNLASQSVLEGLNACLDHRAEVYIPELGRSFQIQHQKTRIFACQNPLRQGGGRKGLPKSFLNRFTQVYIEPFTAGDLLFITHSMYPMIDEASLSKMVEFSNRLYRKTMVECRWGQRGGPWEFNLRDLFRWCDLMTRDQGVTTGQWDPGQHVGLIYADRMRTAEDKQKVLKLYEMIFSSKETSERRHAYRSTRLFHLTQSHLQVGHSVLPRERSSDGNSALARVPLQLLHHSLDPLESLIKCIAMNWMAILVGPSSSGKTSLVHLLAQLTGHRLQVLAMNSAMDTTELLGGFEQADLNRHWESLLEMINDIAMATIRNLLISTSTDARKETKRIMGILSALRLQSTNDQQSSVKQRCSLLDQLLSALQSHPDMVQEDELAQVMEAASAFKAKCKVEDSSTPGGGGKFEWVDGLLVKALQNGDWLLVDNVNFCSPSVLDRLNALLEPGGVLTINERGVIDGEIPSITPHPQFRLILSMDSRHGEISRAMRNRGVEIYMLGEHEGGLYSDQDTLTLLRALGLTSPEACATLMTVHREMRACLQGADSARLPSLLLAASLALQLTQNGLRLMEAVGEACAEVYVNSQLLIANKRRAKETLERCLSGESNDVAMETDEHTLLSSTDAIGDIASKASPVTDAHYMSCNAALASVEQQGALLRSLLGQAKGQDDDSSMPNSLLMKAALLLVLEQASPEDWGLRRDWLKSQVSCSESMIELGQVAENVLQRVFTHPLTERIRQGLTESCSDQRIIELLINSPTDLHWNRQLLEFAKVHLQRASADSEDEMEDDTSLANEESKKVEVLCTRLCMILRRTLSESLLTLQPKAVTKKRKPTTALEMSLALQKGHLSSEALPHPSLVHIGPLFQAWDRYVSERLAAEDSITEQQAYQVLVACDWRDRMWQLCMQPIRGSDRFSLGQLALHWDWFLKETVQVVKTTISDSSCLPVDLQTIMQCLHASLTHNAGTASLAANVTLDLEQWESLSDRLGQPLPFQTQHQAEMSARLAKICRASDVVRQARGDIFGRRDAAEGCVRLASSSAGSFMRRLLLEAMMKVVVLMCQDETSSDMVGPIEWSLVEKGLLPRDPSLFPEEPDSTPAEENGEADSTDVMSVWLWPIKEHLAVTTSQRVVSQMMQETFQQDRLSSKNDGTYLEEIRALYEFMAHRLPTNPTLILPLDQSFLHPHGKLGSVRGHMGVVAEMAASHLHLVWSNTVSVDMERWLSWKSVKSEEEEKYEQKEGSPVWGPANLHTPVQSRCMFHLLSDQQDFDPTPPEASSTHHQGDPASRAKVKGQAKRSSQQQGGSGGMKAVPLRSWEDYQAHLGEVEEILWAHSGWSNSRRHHFMTSSVSYLVLTASWLLRAFASLLLDEDQKTRWLTACSALVTMVTDPSQHASDQHVKSPLVDLAEILDLNRGRSQGDGEALPLVRDERGGALRVIDGVSGLVMQLIEGLECLLNRREHLQKQSGGCSEDLFALGRCWVHLGHLQAVLLAPQGPVDPAQKQAIRLGYIREEISELEAELEARSLSSQILTGRSLDDLHPSQLHSRVAAMQDRLASLREMEAELAKRNAFRPHPPQFDNLLRDITVYLTSTGSSKTIEGLLQKLSSAFSAPTAVDDSSMLRNEERLWQSSLANFLSRIGNEYPAYRDLWFGFSVGVTGLRYGMRLVAFALQCRQQRQYLEIPSMPDLSPKVTSLEELVVSVAGFPTTRPTLPTSQSLAEVLTTHNVHSLLEKLWTGHPAGHASKEHLTHSILKIALHHATNHAHLHGLLDPATLDLLQGILGSFVSHYHRAETASKQREEEEASLYRYRSRSHGDGMTDEQMEEKELRESFPSFDKEFADITAEPTLDDPQSDYTETEDGMTADQSNDHSLKQLDAATMRLLRDVHGQLFTQMTRSDWLDAGSGQAKPALDHSVATRLGYAAGLQLIRDVLPFMDPNIDGQLAGAHLMRVHDLQVSIATEQSDEKSRLIGQTTNGSSRPYDMYHDPNIQEAIRCKPVLEDLQERIQELLTEWPDHPTLKQLNMLIDRIFSFSVDLPLMQFVTGLELLLTKAQEWETNASKAVSIQTHLESITETIIRWRKLELKWRKLELNCWAAMLDNVTFKQSEGSFKWWFHVYRLVQSHLSKSGKVTGTGDYQSTSDTEKDISDVVNEVTGDGDYSGGDDLKQEEEEDVGINGIVNVLEKLLEGASLGEFAPRLQMLLSYHCQVSASLKAGSENSELSCILWNMYLYYSQFQPAVSFEVDKKRKPIEKELKNFVKIAKWNDISFWAMKQAVEKTHKTLLKFSKKFQNALQEPAKSVFVDDKIALSQGDQGQTSPAPMSKMEWKRVFGDEKYQEFFTVRPDFLASVTQGQEPSLLSRLPTLFVRMTKHCTSLVTKATYSKMADTLDEFVGEIITTLNQLQSLDVSKDAEADKQKKEIRHIHLRKRKALSELFKYLASIGLSYKKGLVLVNQKAQDQPDRFLFLPPVDLKAVFKSHDQWPVPTADMPGQWSGCHHYYFRCQARRAALRSAIANPAKELGVGNIDRVKGYSEHLSDLMTDQRNEIATMATGISQLRQTVSQLQSVHRSSQANDRPSTCHLPPQDGAAAWIARSKVIVDQSVEGLVQFDALMDCCPKASNPLDGEPDNDLLTPVPKSSLSQGDLCRKGDAVWSEVRANVKACQELLETVKASIDPCANQLELRNMRGHVSILSWMDVSLVEQCHTSLSQVCEKLRQVVARFVLPETGESTHVVQSLAFIIQCLQEWIGEYRVWHQSLQRDESKDSRSTEPALGGEPPLLTDVRNRMEETVTSVLLGVQSLVKADHVTKMEEEQGTGGERDAGNEEESQDIDLDLEDLLVKKMVTGLSHDHRSLEVTRVVTSGMAVLSALHQLRGQCVTSQDEEIFNECAAMATSLIPMMQQYLGLACVYLQHMVAAHRSTSKLLSVLLAIFTDLATKGFCLPAEYSDEMAGEGATEFEDIEGGGIGDGEGAKDVSDQIENEDQVEDTKMPGEKEKEKEDETNQPDLQDEEHGIEMSEDFEGKLHDQDPTEGEENEDQPEKEEEEQLEKQMGDVDGPDSDKLDERMWGDEEEEEEEEDGEKEERQNEEEMGGGMDEEESRMVAKDDNQGEREGDDNDQQQDKKEKENQENQPPDPNSLEPKDESEFNDDEVDPRKANDPPEAPTPEELDLPDDLEMDKDEKTEEGEDAAEGEENPFDIEEKKFEEKEGDGEEGDGEEGENKEEEKEEEKMETEGESGQKQEEEPVAMETNDDEEKAEGEDGNEDGTGEDKKGVEDKGEENENQEEEEEADDAGKKDDGIDYAPDQSHDTEQQPMGAEMSAKSKASRDVVEPVDDDEDEKKEEEMRAEDAGKSGEDKSEDKHKSGTAESQRDQQGHEGSTNSEQTTAERDASREQTKHANRPSQSDSKRSLGSTEDRFRKRLKTTDPSEKQKKKDDAGEQKEEKEEEADLYEHLMDSESHHDAQTMDAATEDQMKEKESVPTATEEGEEMEEDDADKMTMGEDKKDEDQQVSDQLPSQKLTSASKNSELEGQITDPKDAVADNPDKVDEDEREGEEDDEDSMDVDARGQQTESTIHTVVEHLGAGVGVGMPDTLTDPGEIERLRREMEEQLALLSSSETSEGEVEEAERMWQSCESVTSSLARDLCEQLRLVLEPTQASKLRGDFRTGKRLNMRKVIPYIASGFRKDKIWLRRTKPSKRQYQIMLAVDDSSSMDDNRSKRLAFESLAVISNALTWLEAGQLSVCSFGESVQLLHPFHEQFSDQSGAQVLRRFTFAQKKTKIAQLLKHASATMMSARSMRPPGGATAGHPETSQLLVIVSDGRGLFLEGMETVKNAVRAARDANIFLMFLVIDNPENKDSILDIRVPIFKQAGAMPEIQSYMEHFPFPFYIILRNINALPETLSDALRQWFELVTAGDKS